MPIYVMMTTLTDEGRKTVRANPQRIKEVNKEVENMGVKILAQYALLGQYDFINILTFCSTIKFVYRNIGVKINSSGGPYNHN